MLNGYLSFMAIYDTILVAVFALLAVQAVRAEESRGRAEPVLATATGRVRWLGTYLVVIAAGATAILAATGLAFGIGAAISSGDAGLVLDLTVAHAVRVPEVLVFMAVAALLYGIAPRALPFAWVVLVYATVLTFFGPLLDPPAWLYDLSPLDHIGRLPLEDAGVVPVLALSGVAAAVSAIGLTAFRRRDLTNA